MSEGKVIKLITYDQGYGHEQTEILGRHDCIEILECLPKGEGDKFRYDINFKDGRTVTAFKPICVSKEVQS
jgi:hypothetical protein